MKLSLVPVTQNNWRYAVFLTTDSTGSMPLDEQWIASNAFSLLQCQYDSDWDCCLLMDDETAVGFAFYGYWRERDCYLLCRYMIDVKQQNKGYGKAFLPMVIDRIRQQYDCTDVYTTVDDKNMRAIALYTSAGFKRTEQMDEEERVYVLGGD